MNVGAIGGPAGAPAPQPLHAVGASGHARTSSNPPVPATPGAVPAPGDSVASFLATGKIADLIAGIDQRRPVQSPEVIAEMLREAVSAAEEGDFLRALERSRELVSLDPERADTLAAEPAFESIRAEITQLLRDLAAAARSDAEQKLNDAHEALAIGTAKLPQSDRADLQTILSVAVQLFETGQHVNYVRAGDLAEVVMVQSGWTQAGVPVWVPVETPGATRTAGRWEGLWQRVPLPVLVLAWLALGIAAALPFLAVRTSWPVGAFAIALWGVGLAMLIRLYRKARRRMVQAAATHKATW